MGRGAITLALIEACDSLSPLLFNLVADVLGVLLDKAVTKGHIKGVLDYLIPRGFRIYNMLMIPLSWLMVLTNP